MSDIEPGDLIRKKDGRVSISEHAVEFGFAGWKLIAKGPGWVSHDGSSVNPVPGAECEAYYHDDGWVPCSSSVWPWAIVQFYRVTKAVPAPVEAPIKVGSKVTVELELVGNGEGGQIITVKWPDGHVNPISRCRLADLPWLPPAPVLRVGGRALVKGGLFAEVRGIESGTAWLRFDDGVYGCRGVSDLTALEDEGQ
jgi:hypothetical protein